MLPKMISHEHLVDAHGSLALDIKLWLTRGCRRVLADERTADRIESSGGRHRRASKPGGRPL